MFKLGFVTRLPRLMNEMEQAADATPPPRSPVEVVIVYVRLLIEEVIKNTTTVSPQLFRDVMRYRIIAPKHMLTRGFINSWSCAAAHRGQ